ncbi:MAG: alpha/beta hydrolase [Gemmiger sp.]
MRIQTITLNEARHVTLTAYLQTVGGAFSYVPRRPAILILPGGGYQYCSDREADPVAAAYLQAGYQAFILRYSVKEHAVWPNPLNDYDEAMALIRARAGEWGLYPDKVAVIGFSAGGHLAAAAATMAKNRPNAAILGYAVAGEDVKACCPTAPDTTAAVDGRTCPCFLFATRTDQLVPIANTLRFQQALDEAGVSFESHIYAYGPHGFSTCDSSLQPRDTAICDRAAHWVRDSIGWLRDVLGDFGDGAMTPPACPPHVNGNSAPFCSADCTIGLLLANPAAAEHLQLVIDKADALGADIHALRHMTLRAVLDFLRTPPEQITALDEALRTVPNC